MYESVPGCTAAMPAARITIFTIATSWAGERRWCGCSSGLPLRQREGGKG